MTDEFPNPARDPRELQNPEIIDALGEAIRKHGIELVAKRLRKSPGQLYGEVNKFGDQRKAKLSLDDAIEASRVTGNTVWLEMVAAELGMTLMVAETSPDKGTVCEELTDDMDCLAGFSRVARDPESSEADIRAACLALRMEARQTEALAVRERRESSRARDSRRVENALPAGCVEGHVYRPGKARPDVVVVSNETVERKQ